MGATDYESCVAAQRERQSALKALALWNERKVAWDAYEPKLAAWNSRNDAYRRWQAVVASNAGTRAGTNAGYVRAKRIALDKLGLPQSLLPDNVCITADQKARYREICAGLKSVRGLSGYMNQSQLEAALRGQMYPQCAMAELAVCQPLPVDPPAPAAPGTKPLPPPQLGPQPMVPADPGDCGTPRYEEEEEEEDEGSGSFAMYGVLALLVVGGGYVAYRTLKK